MISVVIATKDHERAIGPVLSALVAAAVDGVVRQVIVADGGSSDATLEIAKDAGADVLELTGTPAQRIAEGCARAKADWLLILDPEVVPPLGWEVAARAHLEQAPGRAAWFTATRAGLPGGLLGGPPRAHGLIVSRRMLERAGGYGPGLARKLGGKLVRLKPSKRTL